MCGSGGLAMGLIITVLLLGLLASISPSTIVVFILMLSTTRARANAGAFLIGWSVSLVIVFAASYALGGVRVSLHGTGRIAVDVIEVLLGIALLAMAARQWQHRNIPRSGSGLTKSSPSTSTGLLRGKPRSSVRWNSLGPSPRLLPWC